MERSAAPTWRATLAGHSADAITTGPDGNLWFTDSDASIDTVNPGTPSPLTPYGYTTTGSPEGIASDPAHSQLLFSELAGSVGTVTTTGTVTLNAAITGQNIFGITLGPDG